jgi:ABC-type multidrug transport system fused ATPase/permease subunit
MDLLMARRTVLLITHRLAALEDRVDEVLVLEGGRVVERGSPRELIYAGGRYAHYQDYLIEQPTIVS